MSLGLNDLKKKKKAKSPQQEFPMGAWAGKVAPAHSARAMRPWSRQGPDSDVYLNQQWIDQHSSLASSESFHFGWLRFQEPLMRLEDYIVSIYKRSRMRLRRRHA